MVGSPNGPRPIPVAHGDRITWTLQYDRSALWSSGSGARANYAGLGPFLTNLVDQTNGFHFYTPPAGTTNSTLILSNGASGGTVSIWDAERTVDTDPRYTTSLILASTKAFSTFDLAKLQLDKGTYPVSPSYFPNNFLQYDDAANMFAITAELTSISSSATPEPGTLTLYVLGALALVAGRRCRTHFFN